MFQLDMYTTFTTYRMVAYGLIPGIYETTKDAVLPTDFVLEDDGARFLLWYR